MSGGGLRWLAQTLLLGVPRLRPRRGPGGVVPLLAAAVIVAGCVTTGATPGFSHPAAAAVDFGLGIAVAVAAAAMVVSARLHRVGYEVAASSALLAVAGWTVVATAWTLPAEAAAWIGFADGLGYIVIALAMLLRRGLVAERLIHVLEVRELR